MPAIKILLAVHHFLPRYTGGAEREAYRTAAALQARGHQVRVLCVEHVDVGPCTGVAWEDDVYGGVAVRRLSFNQAAAPDPFQWEYDNPWIGDHLADLIAQDRPDIFHLMGGYLISGRAVLVARQLGVPVVVTLVDFWYLCRRITMLRSDGRLSTLPIRASQCARCLGEERRRYRLPAQLAPALMDAYWRNQPQQSERFEARQNFLLGTLNQADLVICRSLFFRTVYGEAGLAAERSVFLRQGFDVPDCLAISLRKTRRTGPLRVGYIGQIASHKGVHVLLQAARQLAELPLTVQIFGDTSRFPAYARSLQQLRGGDTRIQIGAAFNRPEDLTDIYRNLDVLVVPSVWYENSPNVILEALAHRTPVIVSDLGAMTELVQPEKNGLAFEPGNPQSLARQLARLVEQPELLTALTAGIGPVPTMADEINELELHYQHLVS